MTCPTHFRRRGLPVLNSGPKTADSSPTRIFETSRIHHIGDLVHRCDTTSVSVDRSEDSFSSSPEETLTSNQSSSAESMSGWEEVHLKHLTVRRSKLPSRHSDTYYGTGPFHQFGMKQENRAMEMEHSSSDR